jgi:endonuclease/exonuclease/phosphatase family metal-dependent hydrolase
MLSLNVALLLSLLLAPADSQATIESRESRTLDDSVARLRVVSYNIAAARDGSLEDLAEVIGSLDADVVALQEVASNWAIDTGFDDQAAVLGDLLGMEVFYAPIYSIPDEDGSIREFGLAILSRHPFTRTVNHSITRHSTQEENRIAPLPGFPEAAIEVGGLEVRIFNTHLDYRRDPSVRQTQISEMLSIMTGDPTPTLLVGDLNARPDAPELQPLFDVFKDVWATNPDSGYTHPANEPRQRIDYILVSPSCSVESSSVVNSIASDHRPVVASIICPHAD